MALKQRFNAGRAHHLRGEPGFARLARGVYCHNPTPPHPPSSRERPAAGCMVNLLVN